MDSFGLFWLYLYSSLHVCVRSLKKRENKSLFILLLHTVQKYEQRTIPDGESYVLEGLEPNTVYNLWLAAKSQRGEGAATAPIPIRTEQSSESRL